MGAIVRLEGWEKALDTHIQTATKTPFAYGACDCVVFASDAVLLSTGIDPMLEGRGKYDNMRDGALLIAKFRGSYEGIMDFYFERIENLRRAMRGDIVLKTFEGSPAYGVVWNGKAFFKSEKGMLTFSLSDCEIAWRVD